MAAIETSPKARAVYAKLSAQNRSLLTFRTDSLKSEEARKKKIRGFVEMFERGETIHPNALAEQDPHRSLGGLARAESPARDRRESVKGKPAIHGAEQLAAHVAEHQRSTKVPMLLEHRPRRHSGH